jgi:hypothetical protein
MPITDNGLIRESMQVTIAKPFWATPVKPEYLKVLMYSSLAANSAEKESCGKELSDMSTPSRIHTGAPRQN